MKFDVYSLKGRVLPALFTIVLPIMVFNHFCVSEEFSKFVGEVIGAKIVSNLTIAFIALYFLSEAGRMIGKNVFEKKYFKGEMDMPTTCFLLFGDSQFSVFHKVKIRKKIKADFKIVLPGEEEEKKDVESSKKQIVEALSLIRKKLHGNKFLLQHNVEYGAMRNSIGGSVLGAIVSIANCLFFVYVLPNDLALLISFSLLLIYGLLILLSKVIIDFYGINYAKILFREYIAST